MEITTLTVAQKRFLESYLQDILDDDMSGLSRGEFSDRVSQMDFDDGVESSLSQRMIAQKLLQKGLLSELEIHNGHIYLVFSKLGGEVLFDLKRGM